MSPNPFSPKTPQTGAIEIIEKPLIVKSVISKPAPKPAPPPLPPEPLFPPEEIGEIIEEVIGPEIKSEGNKPDHLWKPGQSGNPAGRPKQNKSRELAGLLTKAGTKRFKFTDDTGRNRSIEYNEFIAGRIMEALSTGQVTFPPGIMEEAVPVVIRLNSAEWMKLVDFFFKQVDGLVPKSQELDKTEDDTVDSSELAQKIEITRQTRWGDVLTQLDELIDDDGSEEPDDE